MLSSLVVGYPSSVDYGFPLMECALSQIRHWLATPLKSCATIAVVYCARQIVAEGFVPEFVSMFLF